MPELAYLSLPKLDTVARLGGNTCSTIRDRFEMPTPMLAEFEADAPYNNK